MFLLLIYLFNIQPVSWDSSKEIWSWFISNRHRGREADWTDLTCLDIPASRIAFMQTLLCIASKKVELSKLDINDKIQKVKHYSRTPWKCHQLLNWCEVQKYHHLKTETPGQNASQTFSLAVETNSDREYVLTCDMYRANSSGLVHSKGI